MPPVFWAIEHGYDRTLQHLVANGVDIDMLDGNVAPRRVATTLANYGPLYNWEAKMDFYPDARFTPLAYAAYHGRDAMVKLLLDKGASIEMESALLCKCGNAPPLRCPEELPHPPVSWEPYDDGRDLEWEDCVDHSSWTPLHLAICRRHASTAKLLIERGASAVAVGGGQTALHTATGAGSQQVIDYLLDKNLVDINAQDAYGLTPLHVAYATTRYRAVDKFLDRGADINLGYTDASGPWTIFSMALAEGDFDRALKYLRRGADPDIVPKSRDHGDTWTAMRFIYGSRCSKVPDPLPDDDTRVLLEREVIARGRQKTGSDA